MKKTHRIMTISTTLYTMKQCRCSTLKVLEYCYKNQCDFPTPRTLLHASDNDLFLFFFAVIQFTIKKN